MKDCFKKHGTKELHGKYEELLKTMPERQAAHQVVLDEHERLFNTLNDFKANDLKTLKVKPKYERQTLDTEKLKELSDSLSQKNKEADNKRAQSEAQKELDGAVEQFEKLTKEFNDKKEKLTKSLIEDHSPENVTIVSDKLNALDEGLKSAKQKIDKAKEALASAIKAGKETKETVEETPTEAQAEQVKPKTKLEQADDRIGSRVKFTWLGDPNRTGFIHSIKPNGDFVIMDDANGRKYSIKKADLSKGEAASTKKIYEELGVSGKNKAGRISIAPLSEGILKRPTEIVLDLVESGIAKFIKLKKGGQRRAALGFYRPATMSTHVKYNNDLDTTSHELGHSLDDAFDIVPDVINSSKGVDELNELSKHGSKPPKNHPNPQQYKYGEGLAEFIRALIVNPGQAQLQYPEIFKVYKSKVSDKAKEAVDNLSNEIRRWAGSTALEKMQAVIDFNPTKQEESLWAKLNPFAVKKDGFHITWGEQNLTIPWLNPFRALEKAWDYAIGVKGLTEDGIRATANTKILARLFLGSNTKIDNIMSRGMIDGQNRRLYIYEGNVYPEASKGFIEVSGKQVPTDKLQTLNFGYLTKAFDAVDEKSLQKEIALSSSIMVAKRVKELHDRFQKENAEAVAQGKPKPHKNTDHIIAAGAGIFKDMDIINRALQEYEDLKKINPKKVATYEEAHKRFQQMAEALLQYQLQKGRLSQTLYDEIKANNLEYVGLGRVMDERLSFRTGGKLIGAVAEFHRLKGSSRDVLNPYQYLLEQTYKTVKETDRNEVMQSLVKTLLNDREMYDVDKKSLAEMGMQVKKGEPLAKRVWIDGEEQYWKFHPDIQIALDGLGYIGDMMPAFWTKPASMLRYTITNFPVFALRNRLKDVQQRAIVSPSGGKFFDKFKFKKQSDINRYELFGGDQSWRHFRSEEDYYKKLKQASDELAKRKSILIDPKKFATFKGRFNGIMLASERSTRVEEFNASYKQAISKGMSEYEANLFAAYNARDLLDFAVIGEKMRIINSVIPFTNAAVQGLRKSARSFKKDPSGWALRWVMYSLAPEILIYTALQAFGDDDDKEDYDQLSPYIKDTHYIIYLSDGLKITFPKPYDIGMLSSGSRRLVEYGFGNDHAFDGFPIMASQILVPIDPESMAGWMRPFLEAEANYDFFRQKRIIKPYEEGLDIELRKNTKYASKIGQGIQSLVGYDARKTDHVIKGTTGYFGRFGLKVTDLLLGGENDFTLADTGLFRKTYPSELRDVKWVEDFLTGKGDSGHKIIKELNELERKYYATNTDSGKYSIIQQMIKISKAFRDSMEGKEYKKSAKSGTGIEAVVDTGE